MRHFRIPIVGLGGKKSPEHGLRVFEKDREVEFFLIPYDQWFIIGNELGEKRNDEKGQEDPERPVTASVRSEEQESTSSQRRWFEKQALLFQYSDLLAFKRNAGVHDVIGKIPDEVE